VRCAGRPLSGGLVVPWITLEHNGHAVFGGLDHRRWHAAMIQGLCQICGQTLTELSWLVVRPRDVDAGYTPEPAMHPECFRYSVGGCPMLNGQMSHYRTTPLAPNHPAARPCTNPGCGCREAFTPGPDTDARSAAPAEDWDGWMIRSQQYQPYLDTGQVRGVDLSLTPVKVRPVRRVPAPLPDEALEALTAIAKLFGFPRPGSGT
jgi:hypothetical protein